MKAFRTPRILATLNGAASIRVESRIENTVRVELSYSQSASRTVGIVFQTEEDVHQFIYLVNGGERAPLLEWVRSVNADLFHACHDWA